MFIFEALLCLFYGTKSYEVSLSLGVYLNTFLTHILAIVG